MPTETLPSPMARALRSANIPLAASLATSHPHSDIITNPVTATGLTPLHLATILRDQPLVNTLLSCGAVTDVRVLKLAAQAREAPILQALLAKSPRHVIEQADEVVHVAAWAGALECVQLLADAGVGLEWRAEDGATALCCAVIAADLAIVQCLLQRGAKVVGVSVDRVSVEEWAKRIGGPIRELVSQHALRERRRPLAEQ